MWSVGIIFYSLVCNGILPFQTKDKQTLYRSIRKDQPNTFNYEFCQQKRETKDLILKMLIKDPNERISTKEALSHQYFKSNYNIFMQMASSRSYIGPDDMKNRG